MASDLISSSSAADIFGVSEDTIRRWADQGRISCVLLPSGHRRYYKPQLLAIRERGTR